MLSAGNARCSCGRRCRYACTKYQAQVSFATAQEPAAFWVSAGSAHGYDQPVAQAYRDTFGDIWGAPLAALMAQVLTLVGSFSERRHTV